MSCGWNRSSIALRALDNLLKRDSHGNICAPGLTGLGLHSSSTSLTLIHDQGADQRRPQNAQISRAQLLICHLIEWLPVFWPVSAH